jgi:bacterioferritin-associated ferredoxin
MATGAAQTLLRAYRVAPGRRVLIAGNGPLNLQLAVEFLGAGIKPVAVIETAPRPDFGSLMALVRGCANSPGLMWNGLVYLARLRAAGVPVIHESAVVAAEGAERVERAVIARIDGVGRPMPGTERSFAVDVVGAGYGLMPSTDLSLALGCAHQFDESRGCLLAQRDVHAQTTMEGIFLAGDCAGLGGAQVALEEGFIAGTAAARTLGRPISKTVETELHQRRRRLARHRAFQSSLRVIFDAPLLTYQLASPQTIVCRCEGVRLESITAALAAGGCSLGAVKKRTRAGMGRCQGRYCSPVIASSLPVPGEMRIPGALLAPRPPVKPVPIAEIAEAFEP